MLSTFDPHVVNAPTVVDPDEAVRLFLEELGDDAVIPCTAGASAFRPSSPPVGEVAPWESSPECGAPAAWTQRKPCGHVGYRCEACYQRIIRDLAGPIPRIITCRQCRRISDASASTWRRL
jgi:hypothetical protein